MAKLYVFDLGGVVLKNIDFRDRMIELLGVDAKEFLVEYRHYDFPIMDGNYSIHDFYRHLEHVFGIKVPGDPFKDLFHPVENAPMVDLIKTLRARGSRVVCATNNCTPHWNIIQEKGRDKLFDACYVSHLIGLTKPSKAFFNYVLSHEGVEGRDAVFLDDYEENILGAKALGINALWYDTELLDKDLMTVLDM